MNLRAKPIVLGSETYYVDNYWNSMLNPDTNYGFSVSPTSPIFLITTKQGFGVCENYKQNKKLLEVTAGALQPIAIAIRPGSGTEAMLCFPEGQLLLIDVIQRSRGKTTWLNSFRGDCSSSLALLVRWIDQRRIGVLYQDNTFWVFNLEVTTEDRKNVLALKESIQEPTADHISVATAQTNPIEAWKFFFGRITDLAVARSGELLVVTTSNGQLKVFDYSQRTLQTIFYAYFGGFRCLMLDEHSQRVAVGGEDDSVSVWDLERKVLLARGIGHRSWVSGIVFIGSQSLISIGTDGLLVVWEFEASAGDCSRELLVPYPPKEALPLIRPLHQVVVGPAPLKVIALQHNTILVGDERGIVWLWSLKSF